MQLWENLNRLRRQNNLTQGELAAQIGIDKVTYGRYERGEREPPISLLCKLSKIYGVSIDEMVGANAREIDFNRAAEIWKNIGCNIQVGVNKTVTVEIPERPSRYEINKDCRWIQLQLFPAGTVTFENANSFVSFTADIDAAYHTPARMLAFFIDRINNLETKKAAR